MYTQFYRTKLLQEARQGFGEEGGTLLTGRDWLRGPPTPCPWWTRELSSVGAANWGRHQGIAMVLVRILQQNRIERERGADN